MTDRHMLSPGGTGHRAPPCSLVILAMMAVLALAACIAALVAALFPPLVA